MFLPVIIKSSWLVNPIIFIALLPETGQYCSTQGLELGKVVDDFDGLGAYMALSSTMKSIQLGKSFQINTNLTSSCLVRNSMTTHLCGILSDESYHHILVSNQE